LNTRYKSAHPLRDSDPIHLDALLAMYAPMGSRNPSWIL
jgi:hypothetical protein